MTAVLTHFPRVLPIITVTNDQLIVIQRDVPLYHQCRNEGCNNIGPSLWCSRRCYSDDKGVTDSDFIDD